MHAQLLLLLLVEVVALALLLVLLFAWEVPPKIEEMAAARAAVKFGSDVNALTVSAIVPGCAWLCIGGNASAWLPN